MPKFKKVLGSMIVFATLVGGIVGIAATNPQVKEIFNDFLPNTQEREEEKELVQLESPSNIEFDEEQSTLSFSEIPGASGYSLKVYNSVEEGFVEYFSPVAFFDVNVSFLNTGDSVTFKITAKGDNVTTSDSMETEYSYTMQFVDQNQNILSLDYLYSSVLSYLDTQLPRGNVTLNEIYTIQLDGTNVTIKGVAQDRNLNEFVFEMGVDLSAKADQLPAQMVDAQDFTVLSGLIKAQNLTTCTLEYVYTNSLTNVYQGLESSGAFEQYISQGYTISVIEQKNSNVYSLNETHNAFDVTGVYTATKGEETITFEVKHTVSLEKNAGYNSDADYLNYFNQNGGSLEVKESKVYQSDILKLLEAVNQVKDSQQSQTEDADFSM